MEFNSSKGVYCILEFMSSVAAYLEKRTRKVYFRIANLQLFLTSPAASSTWV